jgi:hypothetical protein
MVEWTSCLEGLEDNMRCGKALYIRGRLIETLRLSGAGI